MFPGEADTAEHLDAALGIVDGSIEADRSRCGCDERESVWLIGDRPGGIPGKHGRGFRPAEHGWRTGA